MNPMNPAIPFCFKSGFENNWVMPNSRRVNWLRQKGVARCTAAEAASNGAGGKASNSDATPLVQMVHHRCDILRYGAVFQNWALVRREGNLHH